MILRSLGAIFAIVLSVCAPGCSSSKTAVRAPEAANMNRSEKFFQDLFKENPVFDSILVNKNTWNVQVVYTQIDRDRHNKPHFRTYTFNSQPAYFYPASTVKLPVALLALERLNELNKFGIDKHTTMITEAATESQSAVYNEPNSPDGRPTIANYIKKIFLVSDNDAFNRLYEFLGQEYVNEKLHKKGYHEAQILHRLAIVLKEEDNKRTNPISFYDSSGKQVFSQEMKINNATYEKRADSAGEAYYAQGQLRTGKMDFSKKNRISLASLNNMLTSLVFPNSSKRAARFKLTEADRNFVLQHMSMYPGESTFPTYDSVTYHDAYTKYIYYGAQKAKERDEVRLFNKSGNAYGQLIDVAYFCDYKNKVEFFVSAAISCNTDGVLNDDKYDYETIGLPFMKNLGEALYKTELNRTKRYLPNLESIRFHYQNQSAGKK